MSSYKIVDHEYDVVVLGAGGSGLRKVPVRRGYAAGRQ